MTRRMPRDSRPASLTALLLGLLAVAPAHAQVVEYYHTDAIGNVRAITDASGNVIERHDYQPYGEEWLPQGGTQPLRFTGKERDAETELDYFGARYYGSKIGRFTTVDPVYTWQENLVDPQRWNRYAHARNNPLRYVDPDGKNPILVGALLAGLFLLNNPTNANVTQGPTQDTIVPNSLIVTAGYGLAAGGVRAAGKEVFEEVVENATGLPVGGLPSRPSEAYDRLKHYGRTPTKADRRALGAAADEVADHNPALVKRYYEGDPSCCERPGYQMTAAERRASATDRSRMARQPRTDSNKQGAEMSRYSQEQKRELNKE
jgi:RHS repeat-associated protein